MEKQVTDIILNMKVPFSLQDIKKIAIKDGIVDEMAILSVMSKLGDAGKIQTYQYCSNQKVHRYVVSETM